MRSVDFDDLARADLTARLLLTSKPEIRVGIGDCVGAGDGEVDGQRVGE